MPIEPLDDEYRNKLLSELKKSGFAAEMETLQQLFATGWRQTGASCYFDLDNEITRNIDAEASQRRGNGWDFIYRLLIEVKKSNSPWVVFRRDERWTNELWEKPHIIRGFKLKSQDLDDAVIDSRIHKDWVGHAVCEPFKEMKDKEDEGRRWYTAATTVAKAAYSARSVEEGEPEEVGELVVDNRPLLFVAHPMVVLQGDLISAHISSSGETVLERVPYAPVRFTFGTGAYSLETYRIDIVTLCALEDYLGMLNLRVGEIEKAAQRSIRV